MLIKGKTTTTNHPNKKTKRFFEANSMQKHFVSVLLVLAFLVPFFTPLAPAMHVKAATSFGLSSTFTEGLILGGTTNFPTYIPLTTLEQDVFVSFPLVDPSGLPVTSAKYSMQYAIENGFFVRFYLEKDYGKMKITYQEFTDSNMTTPAPVNTGKYSIYNAADKKFVAVDAYTNSATNPNYVVDKTQLEIPTFTIEENTGFSFQINGRTVHFLWKDGKMNYMTNGIKPGHLYDFELMYGTLNQEPVSTNPKTMAKVLNGTLGYKVDVSARNGADTISNILDWTITNPIKPAEIGNEIKFTIPMPKAWDGDSYDKQLANTDVPDMTLTLTLQDSQDPTRKNDRFILIKDLFPTLPSTAVTVDAASLYNDSTNAPTVTAEKLGENIVVKVTKLNSSILYDNSTILFGSSQSTTNLNAKKTHFGPNEVHTFLAYEVIYLNGGFNIVFDPYKNHAGYYMLKEGGGANTLNPVVVVPSDGKDKIIIPITPNTVGTYYQLFFSKEQNFPPNLDTSQAVKSQMMYYRTDPNKLGIDLPGLFEVFDVKMTPFKPDAADPTWKTKAHLSYKMHWNIASLDAIKALLDAVKTNTKKDIELVYALKHWRSPIETTIPQIYSYVKVRFYYDANGVVLADFFEVDALGNPVLAPNAIVVPKMAVAVAADRNYTVLGANLDNPTVRAHVEIITYAVDLQDLADPGPIVYRYPSIYFLTIMPKDIQKGDGVKQPLVSSESLFASLTLDSLSKLSVPPMQNVLLDNPQLNEVAGKTIATLDASWFLNGEKVKEYIDSFPKYDQYDIKYNVYITQNEQALKKILEQTDDDTKTAYQKRTELVKAVNYQGAQGIDEVADTIDMTLMQFGGKAAVETLRKDEVLRITDMPIDQNPTDAINELANVVESGISKEFQYQFKGLDKNQTYYMAVDVSLLFKDNNPPYEKWEYSSVSAMTAETTMGDKDKPDPKDKVPPSPVLGKENVGLSSATIFWNKIVDVINTNDPQDFGTIEYEIVRLKDSQMSEALLDDNKTSLETLFQYKLTNSKKVALQTNGTTLFEMALNGKTTQVTDTRFVYTPSEITKLKDNNLSPNSIYFYYVRTVRKIDGKQLYSHWSHITVTTDPVKNPINLKVEREGYVYDAKREILISFDAPIGDLSLLGTNYQIQYSIKLDNEEWSSPMIMNPEILKQRATPKVLFGENYHHFLYTISGLLPGKGYSIRVRMVDLQNGDASMYSNLAETRTDTDQDEYDKDRLSDEWLAHLQELMKELIKDPYWTLEDTLSYTTLVYRPTMFDAVLSETTDSQIVLPTQRGTFGTYYIPQSALLAANAANKGFKISYKDVSIVIAPNAIDVNKTNAVFQAAERIKAKKATDWYLRITTNFVDLKKGETIEGNEPISPKIEYKMEIVTSITNNKAWDELVLNQMLTYFLSTQLGNQFKAEIKEMIEEKVSDEEILQAFSRFIEEEKAILHYDLLNDFKDILDQGSLVTNLENPTYLNQKILSSTDVVKGYQMEANRWVIKPTINNGSNESLKTLVPGIFIFNRYMVYLPNLNNVEGAKDLTDLIVRYGLDDYLGKGTAFNLNNNLTGNMVLGVAARLMGAEATQNPASFLKSKNYQISARAQGGNATLEESLYLLMAVYEQKTNTSIANLKIRNFTLTKDVKNVDAKYLKSVQAAYELGLFSEKAADAKETITISNFLGILRKLNQKIKL